MQKGGAHERATLLHAANHEHRGEVLHASKQRRSASICAPAAGTVHEMAAGWGTPGERSMRVHMRSTPADMAPAAVLPSATMELVFALVHLASAAPLVDVLTRVTVELMAAVTAEARRSWRASTRVSNTSSAMCGDRIMAMRSWMNTCTPPPVRACCEDVDRLFRTVTFVRGRMEKVYTAVWTMDKSPAGHDTGIAARAKRPP